MEEKKEVMIGEFLVALRFREILRCVFWRFMDEGFDSVKGEKILEVELVRVSWRE